MKLSPWPAALLIIACAAYFLPTRQAQTDLGLPPATLTDPLPQSTRQLFTRARPATVVIEQESPGRNGQLQGGLGTGFLISAEGEILTAYHVIDTAQSIRVKTLSGQVYRARVTAFDNAADVALLKIDPGNKPLPFLKIAVRGARVGEGVLAIGNSGGDFLQARSGRLLRLGARAGQASFPQNTLEMSAPLAPGDSGGPILNAQGEVMGVVSYVRVNDEGQTITSYAVPVIGGGQLVKALESGEKRDVPAVGLVFDSLRDGLTKPSGGIVDKVASGSPAEKAGLRGNVLDDENNLVSFGDIITAVDDVRTRNSNDVIFEIRRRQVGETVRLSLSNGNKSREVSMRLVARGSINYQQ